MQINKKNSQEPVFQGTSNVTRVSLDLARKIGNRSLCSHSLSTDVLFSQEIVEHANENNKPQDMTVNTTGWGVGKCTHNHALALLVRS